MVIQNSQLTLEELRVEVEQALNTYNLLGAQQDHRVSQAPDIRTIRYYTSLGLIDRPVIEGRQARYGKRHVLQVLAIKSLQARLLPLSEIQSRIYGRTDQELEVMLAAFADAADSAPAQSKEKGIQPVIWREVVVEPGLKLMVEATWMPEGDLESAIDRLRLILNSLSNSRGRE
jgi:DNA-binding transcriptional MerR regulator